LGCYAYSHWHIITFAIARAKLTGYGNDTIEYRCC